VTAAAAGAPRAQPPMAIIVEGALDAPARDKEAAP
jgi:hypothetical protein